MRSLISMAILLAVVLVATASAQEASAGQPRPLPLRPRSRSLIPDLNRRTPGQRLQSSPQRLRTSQEETKPVDQEQVLPAASVELPNVVQEEPLVITQPQPGQEFVSFLRGEVQAQQKPKAEVRLITEPVPGQEFVSFANVNGNVNSNDRDSVVSARDGEIFYINIDKPTNTTSEITTEEPVADAEPAAIASDTQDNEYYDYLDTATVHPDYYDYEDSTLVYENRPVTEVAPLNDAPLQNIEILTPNDDSPNAAPAGTNVNELYGKYFDESDLAFGKGINEEDKSLFPAESKVRSKFEIKEVNGQLYEYEYRYYYDDEAPEYDYDVVGNIPDVPADNATTISAAAVEPSATTTTPSTTTPAPTTERATAPPAVPASRGRTRGRGPALSSSAAETPPIQENAIVQSNSRGRSRSRGQPLSRASTPVATQSVPARTTSRRQNNVSENSISVGEAKLPTHTRFPPRVTTPAPQARSFGVPLLGDIPEQSLPIAPSKPVESTTELPIFDDMTTTVSPATRSLVNLYALSQAADAEDMETSTVFNDEQELGTIVPYDYLDAAYYDYDFGTEDSLLTPGFTESSTIADYTDFTTTAAPTTTSTTTTTTTTTSTTTEPTTTAATEAPVARSRSRGSLRNAFGGSRSRFSARTSTSSADDKSIATTTETSTTTDAPQSLRRGSNRFGSGFSPRSSSNRFKPFSRSNGAAAQEVQDDATNADKDTKSTTEQSTTTTEPKAAAERLNRFRPRPSFRSRATDVTTTTEKAVVKAANKKEATSPAASKGRSRLFSRLQRGRRPGSKAAEETTEAAVEEGSDAEANETDSNNQETAAEPSTSSTTSAPTTTASKRKGSFGRGRLRGSIRNSRLQVTTENVPETEETPVEEAKETMNQEAVAEVAAETEQSTTTAAPGRRGGVSRPRASSRLSARFNSRGRGRGKAEEASTTTTIAPAEEREVAPAEDVPAETQAAEDEAPVEETAPEEPVEEETNGRRTPGRRAGVFGRFRNRASKPTEVTEKTTTAAPSARRSSFSLLGNRRRRPGGRRGGADEEIPEELEPSPEEEITPLEETIDNELAAQGPQVELEAQASEDLVSVAEQDEAVETVVSPPAEEAVDPEEEAATAKKPKRLSLLSRLRNKNRPARS